MASAPSTENPIETNQNSRSDILNITDRHHTHPFDLKVVRDSFVNCVQNRDSLLLGEYVRAYEELCVFVASLGAVFEWAIRDLNHKLIILNEHQHLDPIHYHSIQSMIEYEVQSGRVLQKETSIHTSHGKPLLNGCRTLLRLHRALAFISKFLSDMRTASDDASSASIAWHAYSSTLGQFHSWPVRQTIHAAIKLTVPDRQTLINKLLNNRTQADIEGLSIDIVESCNTIERITEELFQQHKLTKLP